MNDYEPTSNCWSEQEQYNNFNFWQACKELAEGIADAIVELLDKDNEKNETE